jgi:hypothetical protein
VVPVVVVVVFVAISASFFIWRRKHMKSAIMSTDEVELTSPTILKGK